MDPLVVPALAMGCLLALAAASGHWKKRRAVVASLLVAVGAGVGLSWGSIDGAARFQGGPWESLWLLLVWLEFTLLVQWAGGVPIRGPLGPLAFFGGAFVGELGAAVLLCPRAGDPGNRARVALTASAGAMMSPLGSPVTLLLVEPGHFGLLLPLVLAGVAWPRGWAMDDPARPHLPLTRSGANRNAWIVAAVLLGVVVSSADLWVLFAGCLLLMVGNIRTKGRPHESWGLQIWVTSVALLVFFTQSSGALWELKEGLGLLMETGSSGLSEAAVLVGALTAIVGTEAGAAMISVGVADAGLQEVPGSIWSPYAAGLAVGGLAPLLASGGFLRGLRLWIVQLGVVLLWFSVLC